MSKLQWLVRKSKNEYLSVPSFLKIKYGTLSNLPSDSQQRAYKYYKQSYSSTHTNKTVRNKQVAYYALAVAIGGVGASYGSVPLYKIFCQRTGFGGTTQRFIFNDDGKQALSSANTWTDDDSAKRLSSLRPIRNSPLLTVNFDATIDDTLPWTFVPTQPNVKLVPGETALSFFTATNHSDKAITGVATYNVTPSRAGLYFQKIQCFCFEEQRLLPGESVDMPVFFYIDPEFLNDIQLNGVYNLTLSYFFFHTDEDEE